ncbi:hypothetical protein X275_03250 [Marinitoga sp. 1197]|nr:hypothetical protein X275_03250 [Marinitoga sp. 1197]
MFENFVKAIDESLKESFEKGIEKGFEKGIEKGIEKGKFEGEKTIAKSLLFKKFGDNIVPYLNNLDYLDIKTIEDLTNNIFDITLDEVIKILKSTKS